MKVIVLFSSLALAIAAGSAALSLQAVQPSPAAGYAEGIYADYARDAGGQIAFDLRVVASGNLKALEGRPLSSIVGMPRYVIGTDQQRFNLRNARFENAAGEVDRHELDADVAGFDAVGLPVELGDYRLLAVRATVAGKSRTHQAIEFCWKSLDHCVVYDPSIEFLDSVVNNHRLAKAVGYRPFVSQTDGPRIASRSIAKAGVCGLASNPAYIGRSLTWGAWSVDYKDIFGITLAHKSLGGQQAGLRCNSSCYPAPYGYSNSSSGYGNLGYSVDCGWSHNSGTTGRTGKWIAETKCAHKLVGSAKADVTLKGTGSGVSLAWDTNGGIDSNGGAYTDTCGYF